MGLRRQLAVAAVLGALGAACENGIAGSCALTVEESMTGYAHCITYEGSNYVASSVMTGCDAAQATYSALACPHSKDGSCTLMDTTADVYVDEYVQPDGGSIDFSAVCLGQGGKFANPDGGF